MPRPPQSKFGCSSGFLLIVLVLIIGAVTAVAWFGMPPGDPSSTPLPNMIAPSSPPTQ
jgi:hypothetical protein